MYNIFTELYENQAHINRPPGLELVSRTLETNVLTTIEQYNSKVRAIKSNHLLNTILGIIAPPFHYDLDRYTEAARSRTPFITRHLKLTSDVSLGKIHQGIFYGGDNPEILISIDEYFNIYDADKNWQSVRAVNVIDHPVSNLKLMIPDGVKHNTETGITVITINIPLLLVQYRAFNKSQLGSESQLSSSHFIMMHVLPNMLYSHLDLAIVNRFMNLHLGSPMGDSIDKHPFPIIDVSYKLDRELMSIVLRLRNKRMDYKSYLKNIPSVFSTDSQELLIMPDLARTRQVWWALLLARLKYMVFLTEIGSVNGRRANADHLGKLKIHLKRLREDNLLAVMLDEDLYYDTSREIEELMSY